MDNIISGTGPFYFEGDINHAVLLIHGLTATPKAILPIAQYLHSGGFHVKLPLLPGHGSHPDDLSNTKWQDWFDHVDNEYQALKEQFNNVSVVGVSLGGNLAFCLGAKHNGDIKKIVSIGTPIHLRRQKYINLMLPIYSLIKDHHRKKIKPSDEAFYEETGTYRVWPYQGLKELLKIIDQTKSILPNVHAKTLVVHSTKDPIVRPKSARFIFDHLTTPRDLHKEIAVEEAKHGYISDDLAKEVVTFLREM